LTESAIVTAKKPEAKSGESAPKAQEAECSQPTNSRYDRILFLQKSIGNQAVQRLFKSGLIQAKLQTGMPGDIYEREADRSAERVMRMAGPQVQRQAVQSGPVCLSGGRRRKKKRSKPKMAQARVQK
jgi:hypothetical protein